MDRTPKKACKHCGKMGHFSYACFNNPKRKLKSIKRSPINKIGKTTKQWIITRSTWIKKNPPASDGTWECYLKIHPWCPGRMDIHRLTLDHVVPRSNDPSLRFALGNLRPACIYCNGEKGSKSLDAVKPQPVQ